MDGVAGRVLGPFHRGAALVSAAFAALRALPDAADALAALLRAPAAASADLARAVGALRSLVEAAGSPEGRNLLIRRRSDAACFLVFGLVRQRSGAISVQPIEIDLAAIALADPDAGVLDRLEAAVRAGAADEHGRAAVRERLASLRARVSAATSRLSVVKARLDVQTRFLTAMFATGEAVPLAHLASDLDQARARRMALDMRRSLGGQGLTTGNGVHAAVSSLFGRRDPG